MKIVSIASRKERLENSTFNETKIFQYTHRGDVLTVYQKTPTFVFDINKDIWQLDVEFCTLHSY